MKQIGNIKELPKKISILKKLYKEALFNSYDFTIQKLGKRDILRSSSNLSYFEYFNRLLKISRFVRWTIIYRDMSYIEQPSYWEFGSQADEDSITYFIWIKVTPDLAESIFLKYNLTINWHQNNGSFS